VVATGAAAGLVGSWLVMTAFFHWQYFHYVRQSYGLERIYRRKSGAPLGGTGDLLSKAALYLVPAWAFLARSAEEPASFIAHHVRFLPVPPEIVFGAGALAALALAAWLAREAVLIARGSRSLTPALFLLTHFLVFALGYVWIADFAVGWLVVNMW